MEAEVTILVDSYNADFIKSLTHSALATPLEKKCSWRMRECVSKYSGRECLVVTGVSARVNILSKTVPFAFLVHLSLASLYNASHVNIIIYCEAYHLICLTQSV